MHMDTVMRAGLRLFRYNFRKLFCIIFKINKSINIILWSHQIYNKIRIHIQIYNLYNL